MGSILKKASRHFQNDGTVQSMATIKNVIAVLSRDNDFMDVKGKVDFPQIGF